MRSAKVIQIIIILVSLNACITIYNKENLSTDKLHNRPRPLNVNGYYVAETENGYLPFVLFDNGYMNNIWTTQDDPTDIKSVYYQKFKNDSLFYPMDKKYGIWGWGIWWVENDSIFIEHYVNRAGNYDLNFYSGKVESDTSFRLKYNLWNNDLNKMNPDTLSFSLFKTDFKPDSANYIQLNLDKFGK
ncbi:hypothetical protein G3O08_06170 [Cryomorpha ignava]|uniref:Uncharacterized protein n=1 Tax=Cryomorpha ignava TaxID=101383 RepID=A0A7K3WN53_9FLAO|nr:hypothetical protein [Cryomorpha ignava]NEN23083.1 hypothetical protein [Cryomorpha ignava]